MASQQLASVVSNHTSSSPSAAVAAAAAAAQQAAATQGGGGGATPGSLQPNAGGGGGGLLPQTGGNSGSGSAPPGFPQLNLPFPPGFPANFPAGLFTSLPPGFLNFAAQAGAAAAGAAAASGSSPTSGLKKKQKGVSGAPLPPPMLPGGMNPSHFAAFMANPYGNPATAGLAAAAVNNAAAGGMPSFGDTPQIMSGMPRGRWTEEMTKRLIDLRTKMDAKFRSVARPDRLWAEITTTIQNEFSAQLPRQSTKDKWKNLRSSYRLINQNKHPSHYTKETWPYYQDLEHYMRVRQEQEGKATTSSMQLVDGNPIKSMDSDEDDDNPEDDDDDGDEDGDGKKKSGKKRGRAASGAAAAVAAAAQAAAASAYTNPGSHTPQGAAAVNQLQALAPALVDLLRPKDVSRKERDWATMIRNLTGNLQQNIQDAHQQMIGLTSSVRDIAEKMAPSANTRRIKLETAAQHALRVADVQQEVEVVRAELKHLPLLMPLFEAYRAFFAQHAEQDKLEAYLKEKIAKGQTVIFIALPLNGNGNEGGAAAAGGAGGAGVRPSIPPADILSAREQQQASEMVTYHSTMGGAAATEMHRNVARSSGRPINYALGFVHLVPSWSSIALSRSWIAADLFVSPPARNKGIASLLLTHAKKFAADTGASSLDIHTTVHNMHMQRMFARMEFQRQQDHATFSHTFEKQPQQ